jgi:hypothetical protein
MSELSVHITVVRAVDDNMRRQLSKLPPKLPDNYHSTWNSHDDSGSVWTTADVRVPRGGMHYSTNRRTHTYALVRNKNDTELFACETFTYLTFAARPLCQTQLLFFKGIEFLILSSQTSQLISVPVFDIS